MIAPAAAGMRLLAARALFNHHRHVQPQQRSHVGAELALRIKHHDGVVLRSQAHHHLVNARVGGARGGIGTAQQVQLLLGGDARQRIIAGVQRAGRLWPHLHRYGSTGAVSDDGAGGGGRLEHGFEFNVVGIRQALAVTADSADAHPAFAVVAARFDHPVFQRPAARDALLKVQVTAGHARPEHLAHHAQQRRLIKRGRAQKQGTGKTQGIGHGNSGHQMGATGDGAANRERHRATASACHAPATRWHSRAHHPIRPACHPRG